MKLGSRDADVHTLDADGLPIYSIKGHDTYYSESTIVSKDKFKALIGDGNARVSVSTSSRMGGPYGFSGVSVNCSVTLTVNQDDETIQKAKELALGECLLFVDGTMGHCMELLHAQLEEHYREEKKS